MSDIKNSLKISAPITPYSTIDNYPTHLAIFGKGGLKSVDTLQDRNDIPLERREEGMLVYVKSEQKIFGLLDGIQNENWIDAQGIINGPNAGIIVVDIARPEDPSAGTIWLQQEEGNIYYRDIGNTKWLTYIPPLVDGGEF